MLKANVDHAQLLAALRLVEPLVSERPGSSRVLVEATSDVLTLCSTDGEQSVFTSCPAAVLDEGRLVVPGRLLLDFVRTSQGSAIEISEATDRRELDLVAGESEIAMAVISADEWRAPAACSGDPIVWPLSAITQLGRVVHATSRESSKGALRGVLVDGDWVVATDSYRLAAARVPNSNLQGLVVPGEAVMALARIHRDGQCLVRTDSNRISFESDATTVTSTLIVEPFPAWEAALPPADAPHLISFSRDEMLAALDRLSVLASKDQLGTLTITVDGGRLQLECRVPEIGRQVDHIAGSSTVGSVSYQLKYLRAALEQTTTDAAEIRMQIPTKPAAIREEGFVALVLPVRV